MTAYRGRSLSRRERKGQVDRNPTLCLWLLTRQSVPSCISGPSNEGRWGFGMSRMTDGTVPNKGRWAAGGGGGVRGGGGDDGQLVTQ